MYSLAEKRVLTNPNLLRQILSFAGVEIKRECNICGRIINYQILNQEVVRDHKSYINLETCKIKYFCNEDCLYMYNQRFNNKRFCVYLFLIFTILSLLSGLVVILLESEQTSVMNINLSV